MFKVSVSYFVFSHVLPFQVQVSSSGVGEVAVAAGNVVAAANRFAGKDFTNLNPFANKDQSTNPFDED